MDVFAKCWDRNGGFKTYRDNVVLDNSKIKIDKADVDQALKEASLDVNSILLLADRFVTIHKPITGAANNTDYKKNKNQMQYATKKILNYILLIESDAMDSHKTKLLAYVMNVIAERNLD